MFNVWCAHQRLLEGDKSNGLMSLLPKFRFTEHHTHMSIHLSVDPYQSTVAFGPAAMEGDAARPEADCDANIAAPYVRSEPAPLSLSDVSRQFQLRQQLNSDALAIRATENPYPITHPLHASFVAASRLQTVAAIGHDAAKRMRVGDVIAAEQRHDVAALRRDRLRTEGSHSRVASAASSRQQSLARGGSEGLVAGLPGAGAAEVLGFESVEPTHTTMPHDAVTCSVVLYGGQTVCYGTTDGRIVFSHHANDDDRASSTTTHRLRAHSACEHANVDPDSDVNPTFAVRIFNREESSWSTRRYSRSRSAQNNTQAFKKDQDAVECDARAEVMCLVGEASSQWILVAVTDGSIQLWDALVQEPIAILVRVWHASDSSIGDSMSHSATQGTSCTTSPRCVRAIPLPSNGSSGAIGAVFVYHDGRLAVVTLDGCVDSKACRVLPPESTHGASPQEPPFVSRPPTDTSHASQQQQQHVVGLRVTATYRPPINQQGDATSSVSAVAPSCDGAFVYVAWRHGGLWVFRLQSSSIRLHNKLSLSNDLLPSGRRLAPPECGPCAFDVVPSAPLFITAVAEAAITGTSAVSNSCSLMMLLGLSNGDVSVVGIVSTASVNRSYIPLHRLPAAHVVGTCPCTPQSQQHRSEPRAEEDASPRQMSVRAISFDATSQCAWVLGGKGGSLSCIQLDPLTNFAVLRRLAISDDNDDDDDTRCDTGAVGPDGQPDERRSPSNARDAAAAAEIAVHVHVDTAEVWTGGADGQQYVWMAEFHRSCNEVEESIATIQHHTDDDVSAKVAWLAAVSGIDTANSVRVEQTTESLAAGCAEGLRRRYFASWKTFRLEAHMRRKHPGIADVLQRVVIVNLRRQCFSAWRLMCEDRRRRHRRQNAAVVLATLMEKRLMHGALVLWERVALARKRRRLACRQAIWLMQVTARTTALRRWGTWLKFVHWCHQRRRWKQFAEVVERLIQRQRLRECYASWWLLYQRRSEYRAKEASACHMKRRHEQLSQLDVIQKWKRFVAQKRFSATWLPKAAEFLSSSVADSQLRSQVYHRWFQFAILERREREAKNRLSDAQLRADAMESSVREFMPRLCKLRQLAALKQKKQEAEERRHKALLDLFPAPVGSNSRASTESSRCDGDSDPRNAVDVEVRRSAVQVALARCCSDSGDPSASQTWDGNAPQTAANEDGAVVVDTSGCGDPSLLSQRPMEESSGGNAPTRLRQSASPCLIPEDISFATSMRRLRGALIDFSVDVPLIASTVEKCIGLDPSVATSPPVSAKSSNPRPAMFTVLFQQIETSIRGLFRLPCTASLLQKSEGSLLSPSPLEDNDDAILSTQLWIPRSATEIHVRLAIKEQADSPRGPEILKQLLCCLKSLPVVFDCMTPAERRKDISSAVKQALMHHEVLLTIIAELIDTTSSSREIAAV